jgi:hypothetical protein
MGRRSRKRSTGGGAQDAPPLDAPEEAYPGPDGGELVLRCVLTPRTRQQYAAASDPANARAAATREDVHHRRLEFLFERLAVRWTVAGVATEGQKALLQRFRAASADERAWVRDAVRRHCAEWFPDVAAP